jgi:hypothetical protein
MSGYPAATTPAGSSSSCPRTSSPEDQRLVATGDAYTSHGPRGVQDATSYSHYSLLDTIEQNFGVLCLAHACDSATKPMSPLLSVAGASAQAYYAIAPPSYATPTPMPKEPISYVSKLPSANGWTVRPAPVLGTADNSFGSVAAVSGNDVWKVGNWLPDTSTANRDATLSSAAHFDGSKWTSTPTVAPGLNFSTLLGVAAVPSGQVWTVGFAEMSSARSPLIELKQ